MNDLDHLFWRVTLARKHAAQSGLVATAEALADITATLAESPDLSPTLVQQFAEVAMPRLVQH